jgi:hypothetical protein
MRGWGGRIEPPNGGIKISLIIQLFQRLFGKKVEMRSTTINSFAAVSK